MRRLAALMAAGFVLASMSCASAQTPVPVVQAKNLICVPWDMLARGPASVFLQDVGIEVLEDKRPIDLLIVEDQRVENGAPVLTFRAERQDRRLTFVWQGVGLINPPADEVHILCRPIEPSQLATRSAGDGQTYKHATFMTQLDREARYLLGYSNDLSMFILLELKEEGPELFRKLPMTPSDSPSVHMFGDTPPER